MAIGSLISVVVFLSVAGFAQTQGANSIPSDPRLQKAYRFQQGGWTYVHLEGSPSQLGFQHGYLLAPEIADAFAAIKLFDTHQSQQDWDFFRKTAREMLESLVGPGDLLLLMGAGDINKLGDELAQRV